MKLLTLWEPWATAIALGLKKYETRHWATNYRGDLAIHSAKRKIDEATIEFFKKEYLDYKTLIEKADKNRGHIVVFCDLKDCLVMNEKLISEQSNLELAFGNWKPGRFAWQLESFVNPFAPIPYRGSQGLIDVPNSIAEEKYVF